MNIAIIGASGFIGKNLTEYLLKNTDYNIVLISHSVDNILIDPIYKSRVKIFKANVLNKIDMDEALRGVDVAYYLVHMMASGKNNFIDDETYAAEVTGLALKQNQIKKVIYLGGLGIDDDNLSNHLFSRHKTGNILREHNKIVVEFRASMIIGAGSISFEIVRNIVTKSKFILLPKWSITKTQPIGLSDVLSYLISALDLNISQSETIEIGGQETMSYEEFIRKYADFKKSNVYIRRLSFLPGSIAGLFLGIFNNKKQTIVGKSMISSFKNEMIINNNRAKELFPNIVPKKIEEFFI